MDLYLHTSRRVPFSKSGLQLLEVINRPGTIFIQDCYLNLAAWFCKVVAANDVITEQGNIVAAPGILVVVEAKCAHPSDNAVKTDSSIAMLFRDVFKCQWRMRRQSRYVLWKHFFANLKDQSASNSAVCEARVLGSQVSACIHRQKELDIIYAREQHGGEHAQQIIPDYVPCVAGKHGRHQTKISVQKNCIFWY